MEEERIYKLTDSELKFIIDYIRSEARLGYNLKRILWLMESGNKIKKEALSLAEILKNNKSILKNKISKDLYNYIIEGEEINTKSPQIKLKEEIKNNEMQEFNNNTKE